MGQRPDQKTVSGTAEVNGLPRWGAKLAHRLASLEDGKVHTLVLILPKQGKEPIWTILSSTPLENSG